MLVAVSASILPAQAPTGTQDTGTQNPGANSQGNKKQGTASALHSLRARHGREFLLRYGGPVQ
jgi:hypothetical protein